MSADICELFHQDTKDILVRCDDGAFCSRSVGLVLRCYHRDADILVVYEQKLRVVLPHEDIIESSIKQFFKLQSLSGSSLIEKNHGFVNQVLLAKEIEAV